MSSPARIPDWEAVRGGYPGALGRAYLDTACKGLPGPGAERALVEHLARLRAAPGPSSTDETIAMLAQFERARIAAAALVGADRDEIALLPSTEAGLAAVAAALQLPPGANVVASDLEFVGTVLPWRFLERRGVELRFVPHRDGRVEPAELEAAFDARTRAVVVSSVQEVNGFRVELDTLSELCRARGVLLVVDAIQHVGPLELDLGTTLLDAVAVGGHKWLGAPFGMGFLYVSRRLLDALEPPAHAFMTARPASGGWEDYLESPRRSPADALRFPPGAEKLERAALGTTMAAAGLAGALETLLELGPAAIARRSGELLAAAVSGLERAGAEIVTPRDGVPSSIVCFRTTAEPAAERRLVERLAEAGVLASLRYTTGVGGIRVSPYFYSSEEDVELLAATVADALAAQGRRRRAR